MSQATGNRSRRAVGRVLGGSSAALLFAAAIIQPEVANADDGGFQGGGFHYRCGHFRAVFGFGGIFPPFWWSPFWWFYGSPFYDYGYYGNYPDHRNMATIPAPAITATIPTLAMARSPKLDRPGTIASTPLAIIHL